MTSYILDTNICIYIIKNKPTKTISKFKKVSAEKLAISVVTLAELQYGISKSSFPEKNQIALAKFLAPIKILPFDEEAAIEYGEIRTELENKGEVIGAMDLMIAAHARAHKSVLVTNNIREFKRVKNLKIENWT